MVFIYCEIGFEKQKRIFQDPVDCIQTYSLAEIPAGFEKIEDAVSRGYYLAGFLSYEAGYAFEEVLRQKEKFDFPLLSFGVYPCPLPPPPIQSEERGGSLAPAGEDGFNLSQQKYFSKVGRIQEYISAGDTYQITFCVKKKLAYAGEPYTLYKKLLRFQPVPYPAYIKHKDFQILSLSPEMFLKKCGGKIEVKPMKGTLIRDGKLFNRLFGSAWLHFDPKNRAENGMITDLLRNDLGRICRFPTVKTTSLFEVAKYRTVYQMTSSVEGRLDPAIPFFAIFRALFPSGSVTGAPKIRAMQIIRELEPEERKIYTGAIGFITPKRDMFFNVPIRTILFSPDGGEMGIGGGITHYSTPAGEYEECEIKARFLEL